jgi:two-component system response regulator DctR
VEQVRLVLVEDDPMVMEVNSEYISRVKGFVIAGKAFSGKEALAVIESTKPDLVLLDFFLPDQDGLSLLKELRQRNLPVDVIFVTANRSSEHIREVLRYGAIDYLFKPFRFDRVRTALEQYRSRNRKFSGASQLDQEELDQLTGVRPQQPVQADSLPKGVNEHTLKQILQYLSEQTEPQSAEDVASGTGLARVTVRRYLEYLQKKGEIQMEVQYGSIGRPVNRYKL